MLLALWQVGIRRMAVAACGVPHAISGMPLVAVKCTLGVAACNMQRSRDYIQSALAASKPRACCLLHVVLFAVVLQAAVYTLHGVRCMLLHVAAAAQLQLA